MVTKTQSSRTIWVWGDAKKGIAVVRSARKSKGRYWWDIHHVKDGKVILVHRDYGKAEAIKEARSYARYEKTHPKGGFMNLKRLK